jgi:Disulphide bond corrector protein DsbC
MFVWRSGKSLAATCDLAGYRSVLCRGRTAPGGDGEFASSGNFSGTKHCQSSHARKEWQSRQITMRHGAALLRYSVRDRPHGEKMTPLKRSASPLVHSFLFALLGVNSHTPSESYLIPTEVTLTASAGALSSVRYPKDVEKRFSFSDKPLRVYAGTVRFEADLDLPSGAGGSVSIAGSVSYQACDDKQCFTPAKIPLEAPIAVRATTDARCGQRPRRGTT